MIEFLQALIRSSPNPNGRYVVKKGYVIILQDAFLPLETTDPKIPARY
jgi:hypothetical protein